MDIKQLKYFMAIVEEGQISRAAKRLHISQPPLSLQLKLLEEKLGVILIERDTRSMKLTQAGHMLYQRAEQILGMIDTASKEVREYHGGVRGMLSIGSPPALGNIYIPDRIKEFNERYPEVQFQWREGNTFRVMELLDAKVIEFGIVRLPVHEGAYDSIPLLTEPWVAVTPKKATDQPEQITLAELTEVPLILMHRQSGIRAHDMVHDAFSEMRITPNIFCESDNVLALLSLVERGLGTAIMPRTTVSLRPEDFHLMEIVDCKLESSVAIIWPESTRLSTPARLFLEMFQS